MSIYKLLCDRLLSVQFFESLERDEMKVKLIEILYLYTFQLISEVTMWIVNIRINKVFKFYSEDSHLYFDVLEWRGCDGSHLQNSQQTWPYGRICFMSNTQYSRPNLFLLKTTEVIYRTYLRTELKENVFLVLIWLHCINCCSTFGDTLTLLFERFVFLVYFIFRCQNI